MEIVEKAAHNTAPAEPVKPAGKTLGPLVATVIALMAYFMFSLGDASGKWLLQTYSSPQILFVIHTVGLVLVGGLAIRARGIKKAFHTTKPRLHALRAGLMVVNTLLVMYVLKYLPLADFYGVVFQAPIWVAILSVVFMKERIPVPEWIAIFTGFIGVVIIAGSSFDSFSPQLLASLIIPVFGASGALLARKIGKNEPSTNFALWFLIGMVAVNGAMLPGFYTPPTLSDWGLMIMYGLISTLALLGISLVFARAQAPSQIAPLQYSQMLWGILIGMIVFDNPPSTNTLIGAAILIGSGIYILHCLRRGRLMNR